MPLQFILHTSVHVLFIEPRWQGIFYVEHIPDKNFMSFVGLWSFASHQIHVTYPLSETDTNFFQEEGVGVLYA